MVLGQRSATLSVKGQIVSILSLAGHTVSITWSIVLICLCVFYNCLKILKPFSVQESNKNKPRDWICPEGSSLLIAVSGAEVWLGLKRSEQGVSEGQV